MARFEPEKLCRCGKPAFAGEYCKRCLDRELESISDEDILAASEMYDKIIAEWQSA